MNIILKRTVSGVIAFAMAITSVQISAPHTHKGHAEEVASGVKGDANADGVVTEADLAVYESYFFNSDDIPEDVIEDMDIGYTGEPGFYAYVSLNDYLAVKKYLAGETATVEEYDEYTSYESYGPYMLYTGHEGSFDFRLSVDNTLCEDYEIVWNKEAPSGIDITTEGYLTGTPSADDAGKNYDVIVIGKINGKYAAIYKKSFDIYAPSFVITTEDGEFTYGKEINISKAGTYNITSTNPANQVEATETICISENVDGGKVTLNLNGMNINYGDAYYPGDFIYGMSELCDVDIVLSGSNVIRNADSFLYTEGQVNIYGDDDDTLSLLGNSSLNAETLTINGGKVTVKSNNNWALNAQSLTMLGGSLDASFVLSENATNYTSNMSMTGVGISCENVVIRRGTLNISGNEGALDTDYINGFFVSPLFCDIEVEVSDDGTTYTAIDGSPFNDPDNPPSAYEVEGEEATGAVPTNAIDITDKVINKQGLMLHALVLYQYKVDITADDHGYVNYGGDTAASKTFYVNGGEKLHSGITFTANEGWEIDKITASVNGASPVDVTDISEIVIRGDTVITVTTKDTEAPVINGITNGSNYCGTVEFTVTDDSDVTVTIDDVAVQPDENGVYTIVGDISSYSIIATDESGNETIYTINVYDKHPSLSNCVDNEDGTHTGVCDYCYEDATEDHSFFDGVWYEQDDEQHGRDCIHCDYSELADHDMRYISNGDGTHTKYCNDCGYELAEGHNWGDWYESVGKDERQCVDCGDYDESDHDYSDWTPNDETGMHEKVCANCGSIEEADHSFDEWTEYDADQHIRFCIDCGSYYEMGDHTYGDWTANLGTGYCERKCVNCDHTEEADHVYGDWTANLETGNHEKECENCGHIKSESHFMGEWTYKNEEEHYRECYVCNYTEEADHDFGEWTNDTESGKHKRECENCGHMETGDHSFNDWTPHIASNTHRTNCNDCGLIISEPHSFGESEEYSDLQHITNCGDCAFYWLADHTYGEWTDNPDTGKHERECETCGHTEEADHSFDEWTEYDADQHIRFCIDCGSYYEMGDHTYGDWTANLETGYCERKCVNCDHTEEAEHVFGEWTDNYETNKHERECTVCGHVEEAEHVFGEWTDNHETNKHERECEVCGHTETDDHNFSGWIPDIRANSHKRSCDTCGRVEADSHTFGEWEEYDDAKHIKRCEDCVIYQLADHTYSEWTDNPETGKCERECTACGRSEEAEHVFGEWTDNHESGKHEKECEVCRYTEEAEHVFGEWTDNHETGKHERECETCGHTEEAEHVFGEWTKNQETGKFEKECADCGHTEIADHAYGEWIDNDETGKHERTCEICGETEEADHRMSEWTAAGGGEHKRECTDCGRQEAENHSEEYKEYSEHFHERLCTVCGDVAYGEHLYDAVYEGNEKHRILCTLCGYNVTVESCKSVWEEVKAATCTEEGEEEMLCDVCGEKHTRSIAMLPHEFVNGRCSSCYFEDPAIGDSTTTNPPTGVPFGAGLMAIIPASMMVFFARPKAKKEKK